MEIIQLMKFILFLFEYLGLTDKSLLMTLITLLLLRFIWL